MLNLWYQRYYSTIHWRVQLVLMKKSKPASIISSAMIAYVFLKNNTLKPSIRRTFWLSFNFIINRISFLVTRGMSYSCLSLLSVAPILITSLSILGGFPNTNLKRFLYNSNISTSTFASNASVPSCSDQASDHILGVLFLIQAKK